MHVLIKDKISYKNVSGGSTKIDILRYALSILKHQKGSPPCSLTFLLWITPFSLSQELCSFSYLFFLLMTKRSSLVDNSSYSKLYYYRCTLNKIKHPWPNSPFQLLHQYYFLLHSKTNYKNFLHTLLLLLHLPLSSQSTIVSTTSNSFMLKSPATSLLQHHLTWPLRSADSTVYCLVFELPFS